MLPTLPLYRGRTVVSTTTRINGIVTVQLFWKNVGHRVRGSCVVVDAGACSAGYLRGVIGGSPPL